MVPTVCHPWRGRSEHRDVKLGLELLWRAQGSRGLDDVLTSLRTREAKS